MLLKRIQQRLRSSEGDAEQGAVMVIVIAVSAVVIIVCALIASSAVAATTFSSVSRAQLQARAAAEAGIDQVWTSMQQGTFYCSFATATASGLEFAATMEYFDVDGAAITCSGTSTLSAIPTQGVVTSTGTASNAGIGNATSGNERTVIALFDIDVNVSTVTMDKVFFSDGSYTITNSTTITDGTGLGQANLYSNEDVDCMTTIAIQGSVYVQGDFHATNKCIITGTVWASGSVTSDDQMQVGGDVLSMGGTSGLATPVSLDKAWVGGSVVANGSVSINNTTNAEYCAVAGYAAKVCGSIVSVEGGITLDNGAKVAGNALAHKGIDLGTTNANLIIGGNVVSTTSWLRAKNFNGSGNRVGGFIALGGTSQLPKNKAGNQASSCAGSTAGFAACNPVQPPIPLAGLPAELNFPTNTRVVAPPRESLPRINSDSVALAKWVGWSVETVPCAAVDARIAAGWTGKLLMNVTGCTAPIQWDNAAFTLPGDLVVMSPAGFEAKNDLTFSSSSATTKRTLMLIVPSDAKMPDGTTNLVTWTSPIATDPDYTKPTCVSGNYGDIRTSKFTSTRVETFIYTPCDFVVYNQMINFFGQIYSGEAQYPNNSSITFTAINVPGATTGNPVVGPPVTAIQTSRFDARG